MPGAPVREAEPSANDGQPTIAVPRQACRQNCHYARTVFRYQSGTQPDAVWCAELYLGPPLFGQTLADGPPDELPWTKVKRSWKGFGSWIPGSVVLTGTCVGDLVQASRGAVDDHDGLLGPAPCRSGSGHSPPVVAWG